MSGSGPYDDVVLADDERVRRLVLHFGVPRTICTQDRASERTTQAELNRVLAEMSWGTIDRGTGSWTLLSEEPRLDRPEPSQISYFEYLQGAFPTGKDVDDLDRMENATQITDRAARFTAADEPGQRLKPMFDQMVRSLTLPKTVMKGLNLTKVELDETSLPEAYDDETGNVVRFGRYQFLPAFFNLLITLQKEKRKFSLVFHSFNEEELGAVQKEMGMFCEGRHPCYNGQFKTKKVMMTGEKGTRDLRMKVDFMGAMDRMGDTLSFKDRNAIRKEEKSEGGAQDTSFGDSVDDGLPDATFAPTVYKGNAPIYAGMLCEILEETSCVGILDDHEYWKETKDEAHDAGKVVYVDDGETKLQHLFFDGNIRSDSTHSVDIRDAVTERPYPYEEAKDVYFHQVNLVQAITDPEYYIKALQHCEAKHLDRIVTQKRTKAPGIETSDTLSREELLALGPKEYLYETVMPGLLPALELCQRDRPSDPISFIAFQLLRHPFTYQKSLREEAPNPPIMAAS